MRRGIERRTEKERDNKGEPNVNSFVKTNKLLVFYLFACLSCLLSFSFFWV